MSQTSRSNLDRAGFTLTELLISVVLVLLLVAAIARIFGTTSETIGQAEAVTRATASLEAARTALQADFTGTDAIDLPSTIADYTSGILPVPGAVTERADFDSNQLAPQPAMLLYSSRVGTFINEEAAETDVDTDAEGILRARETPATGLYGQMVGVYTLNAERDQDGDGDIDADDQITLSRFDYGLRSFRTDTLSFFTGGSFASQSSLNDSGSPTDPLSSEESWVWYGHGRAFNGEGPSTAGGGTSADFHMFPGFDQGGNNVGTNTNHRFANEFKLVRGQALLQAPFDHDGDTNNEPTVTDATLNPIVHVRTTGWDATDVWPWPNGELVRTSGNPQMAPMTQGTQLRIFSAGGPNDHLYVTEAGFTATGNQGFTNVDGRADVFGANAQSIFDHTLGIQNLDPIHSEPLFENTARPWYSEVFTVTKPSATAATTEISQRFWTNPIVRTPIVPADLSRRANLLLDGATQFMVEFAGDYLEQDNDPTSGTYGAIIGNAPDGVIDYVLRVLPSGSYVRETRFYGLPRDVDGDGVVLGRGARFNPTTGALETAGPYSADESFGTNIDVRPLADYADAGGAGTSLGDPNNGYPFEKLLPGPRNAGSGESINREEIVDYIAAARGTSATAINYERQWSQYLCAWGPLDNAHLTYLSAAPYALASRNYSAATSHDDWAAQAESLAPHLFRVIVEAVDEQGRIDQPVRMELVFRVPHLTN